MMKLKSKIGVSALLFIGLVAGVVQAAPADPTLVNPASQAKPGDQMLIHDAMLLPSGVWSLRRQKNPEHMARALPQKKPRKRVSPDSMASEMSVGR